MHIQCTLHGVLLQFSIMHSKLENMFFLVLFCFVVSGGYFLSLHSVQETCSENIGLKKREKKITDICTGFPFFRGKYKKQNKY